MRFGLIWHWMRPLAPDAVPSIPAYGRSVVASDAIANASTARRGGGTHIPSVDPSEKAATAGDD
jgi:hypothetical protein